MKFPSLAPFSTPPGPRRAASSKSVMRTFSLWVSMFLWTSILLGLMSKKSQHSIDSMQLDLLTIVQNPPRV